MDHTIIEELKKILHSSDIVHAMWVAGSVAEGYSDELSDIDIWLDIDDGKEKAVFKVIEEFLSSKDVIDINFGDLSPPFTHKVYHLEAMEPYHFIELTLHAHSHKYELIKGIHRIQVLFDKSGVTKFRPFDKAAHAKMLQERRQYLIKQIEIGEVAVTKEIIRGQFMDGMHNYQFWLVEPLIELARIKYSPLKISHGLKHGSRDLPESVAKEIESLYIIKSLDDLKNKILIVKSLVKKYS